MRHRKAGLKLNRTSSHRKAMFRNMVTSLIKYDQVRTTDAKAKELRRWGDKLVTLAKRGDLHARRLALSIVRERAVVKKLFDEAPERFGNVSGGYTRVVKLGRRPGDAATMSLVAYITPDDAQKKKKKKKTNKVAAAAPVAAATKDKDTKNIGDSKKDDVAEASTSDESAADLGTTEADPGEKGESSSKKTDVTSEDAGADSDTSQNESPPADDSKSSPDTTSDEGNND